MATRSFESSPVPPLRQPRPPGSLFHNPPEPSLLKASQISAWAGFRMGIFEASSHRESRHVESPFAVLALVTKGRTRAHLNSRGTTWDFSTNLNTMGLFGPRLEVAYSRWDCEPGAERMIVELDFDELAAEGDLGALLPPRRALQQDMTINDAPLATLLHLMADEIRQGSPHGRLYATSLSLSLAAYLSTHHAQGGRAPMRERGTLSAEQKSRVIATVEAGLARDLDLAELAQVAGISRFHFLRLFKNTFGKTPHRYVLDQRLAAARRLLETTTQPIAQVAFATGFSSQSHLSTAMRRSTGLPPGTWRRAST